MDVSRSEAQRAETNVIARSDDRSTTTESGDRSTTTESDDPSGVGMDVNAIARRAAGTA
jgi:hypothetical protein